MYCGDASTSDNHLTFKISKQKDFKVSKISKINVSRTKFKSCEHSEDAQNGRRTFRYKQNIKWMFFKCSALSANVTESTSKQVSAGETLTQVVNKTIHFRNATEIP